MSFIKQFFTAESPAANYTGQGISIAFLDTGISPVEDFILPKNRIVAFRDLVNGKREPYDDNGHGTHVTGAKPQIPPTKTIIRKASPYSCICSANLQKKYTRTKTINAKPQKIAYENHHS